MDDEDFATMGQYGFGHGQGHPFSTVGNAGMQMDPYSAGYAAAMGAIEEAAMLEEVMGAAVVRPVPRGGSRFAPAASRAPAARSSLPMLLARMRAPALLRPAAPAYAPPVPQFPMAPGFQMPGWRARQLAPGVQTPGENLFELTLNPLANDGILDPANSNIRFLAIPQKPFRGERLIITVNRSTGAGGVRVTRGPLIIGTEPQAANISQAGSADIYAPGAFGVRLAMSPAGAGIEVQMDLQANPAVPVGETVACSITILGRIITG